MEGSDLVRAQRVTITAVDVTGREITVEYTGAELTAGSRARNESPFVDDWLSDFEAPRGSARFMASGTRHGVDLQVRKADKVVITIATP